MSFLLLTKTTKNHTYTNNLFNLLLVILVELLLFTLKYMIWIHKSKTEFANLLHIELTFFTAFWPQEDNYGLNSGGLTFSRTSEGWYPPCDRHAVTFWRTCLKVLSYVRTVWWCHKLLTALLPLVLAAVLHLSWEQNTHWQLFFSDNQYWSTCLRYLALLKTWRF